MAGRPGVAAFDFDGTLTRRDTLLPFLVRLYGRRRVAAALATIGPPWRREASLDRRDDLKVRVLGRLLAGDRLARLRAEGEAYAEELFPTLIPAMVDRVERHREQGHRLVLVSASMSVYLEPLAKGRLGFDEVFAVEVEADDAGVLTGRLVGPNVRGPEKAARLQAWLEPGAEVEIWAYGNSSGDDELLALADHPEWVGRRARRSPQTRR